MLNLYKVFTIIGFKITWLSCVFGEIYYGSLPGFLIGLLFVILFFSFSKNKIKSFILVSCFSIAGYLFDSVLSAFHLFKINAETNLLFLPIWFLVLWPSFCCLLINVLSFLKHNNLLSTSLGLIFGPLSYYAGVKIGLAEPLNLYIFLLISFYWGLMMYFYSKYT
ncbi:DUF2878 domain-containing protein [Alphaproteobacteria bacterium]|nr:DUF2878 domain-containing protein [Alphaproteobacteria bacterium]